MYVYDPYVDSTWSIIHVALLNPSDFMRETIVISSANIPAMCTNDEVNISYARERRVKPIRYRISAECFIVIIKNDE